MKFHFIALLISVLIFSFWKLTANCDQASRCHIQCVRTWAVTIYQRQQRKKWPVNAFRPRVVSFAYLSSIYKICGSSMLLLWNFYLQTAGCSFVSCNLPSIYVSDSLIKRAFLWSAKRLLLLAVSLPHSPSDPLFLPSSLPSWAESPTTLFAFGRILFPAFFEAFGVFLISLRFLIPALHRGCWFWRHGLNYSGIFRLCFDHGALFFQGLCKMHDMQRPTSRRNCALFAWVIFCICKHFCPRRLPMILCALETATKAIPFGHCKQ